MKKTMILMLSLLLAATAWSQSIENADGLEVWVGTGLYSSELAYQESSLGVSQTNLDFEGDSAYFLSGGFSYQFKNAEVEAWKKLSITFEGAALRKMEGSVDRTDYNGFGLMLSSSVMDIEADISEFDYNAGWTVVDYNDQVKADVLIGYYYTKQDYILKDMITNGSSAYAGDVAKYDARMRGMYVGLQGDVSLMENKLNISGQIKYIPNLRSDGDGDWQIYRLNYEQECEGDGVIYEIGASYTTESKWNFGLFIEAAALECDEGDVDYNSYGYVTDVYGNNVYLPDYDFIGQNRCDIIEIDTMKVEVRATYIF